MALIQEQKSLNRLNDLAFASVQGKLDESVSYCGMNEALIEHKIILGLDSFTIFPQLHLPWKPEDPTDRRSNVPNIALGCLLLDGR
jgi:hypothetical protein